MSFSLGNVLGGIAGAVGLPFVGGTALALGSSAANYLSADQQNRDSMQAAQDSRAFSAEQVKEQEAYQTQMSNTSHQREVADLKAAGLNPLLSANAGASTPSGGAATTTAAPVVPELGPAVSSAIDTINMLQGLKESNSRVLKNVQDADTGKSTMYLTDLKSSVADQTARQIYLQNEMLKGESQIASEHPFLTGWMKILHDRGIGAGSALSLMAE